MQSIIVIGAGAAGLMAAKELSANNHVIVLEGNNRLGGRIHTLDNAGFTQPVEAGAEFVHGHLPHTLKLLREAGAEIAETGGEMFSSRDGKWVERDAMPVGWSKLMQGMNELKEDTTLEEFLQQHYGEKKYAKLCDRARGFAQGYDVADPLKVSVFFLRDEWSAGWDDQYRVMGGYGKMIDRMAAECINNKAELYTNAIVNSIEWAKGSVTAHTAGGRQYHADKAVITIPISLLQFENGKGHIKFTPSIDKYVNAARNIGYGGVIKVVLEFATAFWNAGKPGLGFLFCNEFIPTWWTQAPDDTPIITGWLGGPKADALANTDDATLLKKSLASLSSVFGIAMSVLEGELLAVRVFNWPANQFSLGAYSYATPLTARAIEILTTPCEDTLYFAGEALYNGPHPGTVEAALESGKNTADMILHT